jgi:hypothetical protein
MALFTSFCKDHKKVILRHALNKDITTITEILRQWIDNDRSILDLLENCVSEGSRDTHCELVELGNRIIYTNLWKNEGPDQVRIFGLGTGGEASDRAAATNFLRQQITDWASKGVRTASACVPETASSDIAECLRACGFIFEGIASDCGIEGRRFLRYCKHFLYRTIHHSEILDFLRQILLGLGYELKNEAEGFSYRIRAECRPPFSFGFWHRIARMDRDIIIHPPARVLEWHELENLFYPLQIYARRDRPILLHLEKKKALQLIDLPTIDDRQDTLFGSKTSSAIHPKFLPRDNVAFTEPGTALDIRKGLSILFYVNRIGAVGHARVADWYLDDLADLKDPPKDINDSDINGATRSTGEPDLKSGKALFIRFQWYSPLKRPVSLDEIRKLDDTFNPQHARAISSKLFRSILSRGNSQQ